MCWTYSSLPEAAIG
uniref:Uncharacterized protein n=1 Tax=Rhizophora mucronata TaxID=61149 RepID=A0A2P2QWB0_RHIMU